MMIGIRARSIAGVFAAADKAEMKTGGIAAARFLSRS
jgi:hypothetical protein